MVYINRMYLGKEHIHLSYIMCTNSNTDIACIRPFLYRKNISILNSEWILSDPSDNIPLCTSGIPVPCNRGIQRGMARIVDWYLTSELHKNLKNKSDKIVGLCIRYSWLSIENMWLSLIRNIHRHSLNKKDLRQSKLHSDLCRFNCMFHSYLLHRAYNCMDFGGYFEGYLPPRRIQQHIPNKSRHLNHWIPLFHKDCSLLYCMVNSLNPPNSFQECKLNTWIAKWLSCYLVGMKDSQNIFDNFGIHRLLN